jgi:ATP-binding cassette subfamily B protein
VASSGDKTHDSEVTELAPAPSRLRSVLRAVAIALQLVWRADRRAMTTIILLQVIESAGLVGELLVGRRIIEQLAADSASFKKLTPLVLMVGGLMVVRGICGSTAAEMRIPLSERLRRSVSERVVRAACAAPLESFESAAFNDQLQRARNDVDTRAWTAVWGVVSLVNASTSVVGAAIVLVSVSPILLPFAALGVIPLLIAASRNNRSLYQLAYDYTSADRERLYLEGVLTGRDEAKEVRVFRLDRYLGPRFDRLWDEHLARIVTVARTRMRRAVVANTLNALVVAGCLLALVELTARGDLDVAGTAVAVLALRQVAGSLRSTATNLESLQESSLYFQDFVAFTAGIDHQTPADAPLGSAGGVLELRGIQFSYPGTDRVVLENIDLLLEPGRIVAIVGANGSGKTTLAKLACGLYQPTAGQIVWNGLPLNRDTSRTLFANVSPLFQDFIRYELSVRDNIVMGNPTHASDNARVVAAAAAAGCDEFIDKLALGYETRLSRAYENSGELSIGQWQRLAIARAFFRDTPLLVLDEPTSALDSIAEHDLFERLRHLGAGRGVLVISHRFSSVRDADEIVVLDGGQIVERGTHEELMSRQGHYAVMFNRQAAPYL